MIGIKGRSRWGVLLFGSLMFGIALAVDAPASAHNAPDQRPNIVLILADDLGYFDLGCNGSELYQTPNIDRLAEDSLRFDRAYACPTCSPSRSAILSGKNPARLGIVGHGGVRSMSGGGDFLAGSEYSLAEALCDAGYTTCHIGKWHVGQRESTRPQAQGFDEVIAANRFCCPGSYFYPFVNKKRTGARRSRSAVPDLEDYSPGDHLTSSLGKEAVRFIKQQKATNKPFFLNLWYYAVHAPVQAQQQKVDKYSKLVKPEANQRNPAYAGLVEHLDDSVGLVLDALREHGLADNTVVIFFSDNGGEVRHEYTSNYPLRSGKGTLYEGGVRVPMLIRWPGVTPSGARSRAPVVGHDLYPTALAMAGTDAGAREIDGVDLTPVLKDPAANLPPRALHWLRYGEIVHYSGYRADPIYGPSAAILKGGWKMIEHYPTPAGLERRFELFHLGVDPTEQNNLAHSRPAKLAELQKALADWQDAIEIPSYEELAWPAFEKVESSRP